MFLDDFIWRNFSKLQYIYIEVSSKYTNGTHLQFLYGHHVHFSRVSLRNVPLCKKRLERTKKNHYSNTNKHNKITHALKYTKYTAENTQTRRRIQK